IQELEYSTQQLTRQLEQSENLRLNAELASNQSTSESASMRIELVKLTDQLNRAQNMLTVANQQNTSLETTNKHCEVALRDRKMEQSSNASTIQSLEKELVHLKQYAKEKDEEAHVWREKHNQTHVELLNTQANLGEVSSRNQTQETIRSHLEMELNSLREMRAICMEQASQQEARLEKLQNELRVERSKSLELSGLLSDKELLYDKVKNDVQELLRLKDEFSERLQERVSAFDALTRENSVVATRLANMTRKLTESEAELLETKQKLELIEARQQKYKDDNSKYVAVISALEKRLIDRDRKSGASNPSADTCLIEPEIEEVRIVQLTGELKEVKRQIIEYRKSNAISKTERAHLQETVNRMQGELVARSDALRHAVLELEKQRTEYEAKLSNQEADYQTALRQLEIKFKEESDKVKQLEGESNERERLLTEASSQMKNVLESTQITRSTLEKEKIFMEQTLKSLKKENKQLTDDLLAVNMRLDEECKMHRETKSALETKLDEKVEELRRFFGKNTRPNMVSNYCQVNINVQISEGEPVMEKSSNQRLNFAKDAQKIATHTTENYLPELEFSSLKTRRLLTSEQDELPVDLSSEQLQFQLTRSADTLESRVASLKLANQQLRAEVAAACRAVRRLPGELKQNLQPALDMTQNRAERSHEVSLHSKNGPIISQK
ncbi:hypothetical protein P879_09578, partial [Paragonimus westermani]